MTRATTRPLRSQAGGSAAAPRRRNALFFPALTQGLGLRTPGSADRRPDRGRRGPGGAANQHQPGAGRRRRPGEGARSPEPLAPETGHGEHPPVDEEAELGPVEPDRQRAGVQGLPGGVEARRAGGGTGREGRRQQQQKQQRQQRQRERPPEPRERLGPHVAAAAQRAPSGSPAK